MHYTCVPSTRPGDNQICPVCGVEKQLGEVDMPYWHEAEVGATMVKPRPKHQPEVGRMPFPNSRWPAEKEAALHGYASLEEWYIASRSPNLGNQPTNVDAEVAKSMHSMRLEVERALRAEFKIAKEQRAPVDEDEKDSETSM